MFQTKEQLPSVLFVRFAIIVYAKQCLRSSVSSMGFGTAQHWFGVTLSHTYTRGKLTGYRYVKTEVDILSNQLNPVLAKGITLFLNKAVNFYLP
jgi:hypothetical protein